ncbi:dihydrofolate reductase-like domain-containing protein [Calycina marina]|uniref:2,5-diamino-6-ribosylamino-4(3H)-pyrimidinone 5'-phosphate reductase n=1 Tax=Calycina marina TaxID=1763456 RepID=A0A9P8CEJ7_9HELO|nr:dihydrofolate reductase-like domain-containing protein [Calycina marina]
MEEKSQKAPEPVKASIQPLYASFDLKLLEPYLPHHSTPTSARSQPLFPHVTLTYAQSMDGQISLSQGTQTILSGPETKAMTHYLRTRHDAILVGAGTAIADNPGLNSRFADENGITSLEKQPRPVILDASALWMPRGDEKVFELGRKGEGKGPWWLVGSKELRDIKADGDDHTIKFISQGGSAGMQVITLKGHKDWQEILQILAREGIRSVMIEGGASVINSLLEADNQKFVSSIVVTIAPTYLGTGGVVVSPRRTGETNEARLKDVKWVPMGQDIVVAGRLEHKSLGLRSDCAEGTNDKNSHQQKPL